MRPMFLFLNFKSFFLNDIPNFFQQKIEQNSFSKLQICGRGGS